MKGTHLTLEDRKFIQRGLEEGPEQLFAVESGRKTAGIDLSRSDIADFRIPVAKIYNSCTVSTFLKALASKKQLCYSFPKGP